MTSRKQPGVAFWATVVVVVTLVAYPLSMGLIECLASHDLLPTWSYGPIEIIYWPLLFVIRKCGADGALEWYLKLWRS